MRRFIRPVAAGLARGSLACVTAALAVAALGPAPRAGAAAKAAPDPTAREVRRLLADRDDPLADTTAAEILRTRALKGRLTDELAALAAGLLGSDDPFVRALAEWAIAVRVELDNGGQRIAWPRRDPPEWFSRWRALPADALLDLDYARHAIAWGIHRDGRRLLGSAGKVLARAEAAARETYLSRTPDETRRLVARQLAALRSVRDELAAGVRAAPADIAAHRKLYIRVRRAARPIVLAAPGADVDRLLFIKRHPAHSHRNITGSQYPWVHKPGGDLCVQSGLDPAGEVRGVLAGRLGPGHVHGMDLSFDADRVVFAYARQPRWPPKWDAVRGDRVFALRGEQEPTHLYEIGLDGTGLRQITAHPYWSDFEPTYCANGDVAFASDRSGRSSECGKFSADHTVINIYAVRADGQNLRRLSDNKDIDRYPHALDSGLIAYTRWDYQERHFFEVHSIWTVHPDGTMGDAVFNQHMKFPYALRDVRSIPGSAKLLAVATGHHTFAYGPVVVVDADRGINAAAAVGIVTPDVRPQEGRPAGRAVPEGGVRDAGGIYQTPWALSEKRFLASYSYTPQPTGTSGGANTAGFAVYLIDVHGNKELVHRDLIYSCSFAMPLRPRPRPPIVRGTRDAERAFATCYVTDVYEGAAGVERGRVKYLRIAQRVGWPLDDRVGAMRWIPGNAWSRQFGFWAWAPVRVIGTVPVEPDGSAHFRVPADAAVYFQALDDRHMELYRMRTHVTLQPGETRGCRGCHESQAKAPAARPAVPLALAREARRPTPPPWGDRKLLGYEWLIQPILDRHCVRCHGHAEPKAALDLSATRAGDGFLQSFRTLFGVPPGAKSTKPSRPVLVSCSNRFSGAGVTRPMEFGSHRSRLIDVLLKDPKHRERAKLGEAEWVSLVTWIDTNAPYYDTFYNRRPPAGGPPVRNVHLKLPPAFAAERDCRANGVVAAPRKRTGAMP